MCVCTYACHGVYVNAKGKLFSRVRWVVGMQQVDGPAQQVLLPAEPLGQPRHIFP